MLKNFLNNLLNIFYPARCTVCKKDILTYKKDKYICDLCLNSIKKNIPPFCIKCGRHIEGVDKMVCDSCKDKTYYFDRAFSAFVYEGPIKELLHQFKYNGKDFLGKFLAEMLIEFINTYQLEIKKFDFVVPVPLHSAKLRQREYNQAEVLATYIAKNFHLTLLKDALYKIKNTPSQTELDAQRRMENIVGSFKINPKINLKEKDILLIDDILTTGATTSEIAKIIKLSGAKKVIVLTLAS
jgi:ComF family protein